MEIAKLRSKLYDLDIEFLECSSVDIGKLNKKFDAIILYATLEHLTMGTISYPKNSKIY